MTFKKVLSLGSKQFFGSSYLLEKYIITELLSPFFFSLGIFSILGVSIGYLSDLSNKVVDSNLPILMAVQVFFLKIPEFVAYALPISVLLAALMTYGRLNSDNEIIALQSCGVGIYRLVTPALFLGILVTGVSFFFNELIVPSANYQATSILISSLNEKHTFYSNKDIYYPDYQKNNLSNQKPEQEKVQDLKSLFYAKEFRNNQMFKITILNRLNSNLSQIIIAKSARWNNQENLWDFSDGTIYNLKKDASYDQAIHFSHKKFAFSKVPFQLASQGRDPYEMTLTEAWNFIEILKQTGDEKKSLTFEIRIQQKLSFPFICIVFGLVGAATGISPMKINRSTGFGICIIIIFSYYILAFMIGSLGMAKVVTPMIAGWLPTIIALIVSIIMLHQLSK